MKSKTYNKCTFDQCAIVMPSFTNMQCNVRKLKRESINIILMLFFYYLARYFSHYIFSQAYEQIKTVSNHTHNSIWTNKNHFKSYTQWGMYESSIIVYWERCRRTYFMELTRSDSACVINMCVCVVWVRWNDEKKLCMAIMRYSERFSCVLLRLVCCLWTFG